MITDLVKDLLLLFIVYAQYATGGTRFPFTGFFLSGKLIEVAPTPDIFERPRERNRRLCSGRFGLNRSLAENYCGTQNFVVDDEDVLVEPGL